VRSQTPIELFRQWNGRYDYLAFGNTLNLAENTGQNPPSPCTILTQSSASFSLQPGQELVAAYLYWAGVGTGDPEVNFGGIPVSAERTFSDQLNPDLVYFAAYADVTDILASQGNGTYTLSELDLTQLIPDYCGNTTNFGGWAVTVVYRDDNLPLNQLNIFDGLRSVSSANNSLDIILDNLYVLDVSGAKIGFLAWEGDETLAIGETLQINGNVLSNPPFNPADNQFNGTNTFSGSDQFYNMDLDVYSIENNIQPGDTSALIRLTSQQDFVMINNVITVLNSELPDATIEIDQATGADACGDRDIVVDYTVYNVNSTAELPSGTPIAFYANTTLIGQAATAGVLPIGGSESGSIDLTIPAGIPGNFTLRAVVDDQGNGQGIVDELNERNNEFAILFELLVFPDISGITDLQLCDVVGTEVFDLTQATNTVDPGNEIGYYRSEQDANTEENAIADPTNYQNTENPETIWIRVANPDCFVIGSFEIEVVDCPLPDATIEIAEPLYPCRQRALEINYRVFNLEATGPLPAGTPLAFYIDGQLIAQSETTSVLGIGESEAGSITVDLSPALPETFSLLTVADDTGNGLGIVEELNEFNNEDMALATFASIPDIGELPPLLACDEGMDTATFDLTLQDELISGEPEDVITYFTNEADAIAFTNPIADPGAYVNGTDPQRIYVRLDNIVCFSVGYFNLTTENCEPFIPQGFSPNGDGINDEFEISGLIDVFEGFELNVYSREGNLIYQGGNEDGFWNGVPNTGLLYSNRLVPTGLYYYVLQLNDPEYPDAFIGYVYINY
jgi:gliding motility-associated-like protein